MRLHLNLGIFKIGLIAYEQQLRKYHLGLEYDGRFTKIHKLRVGITIWI